jgi:lipopolysaccharide heptosyltransferase I
MTTSEKVPLCEYPARRIALIKPSALGDIVHSLPVLTAVRQRYPAAHIAWVVNRAYEPLLRDHPDLDETLAFDRHGARGEVGAVLRSLRFLSRLRNRRFDLVIDLQGLLRTGIMVLASGARRRVGLSTAREGAARAYTDCIEVPDADNVHAVDRYWLVAEALGARTKEIGFKVPIEPAALQWAFQKLGAFPRPWLMLGVGARWLTKRWPAEHFAALAQQAHQRFGATTIFVGGRDEAPLAQKAAGALAGPVYNLTDQTTLPQLVAVLSIADLMLANDTGPLHLAVALGRPVVAPYTCTRIRLTGPYRRQGSAVATGIWCAGSLLKTCPRLECMTELTPARLWPVVEEALSQWQMANQSA